MAKKAVDNKVAPAEINIDELKAKIEAVLYCIPAGVTVEKLAEKLNVSQHGKIKEVLEGLQASYANKKGLQLINESNIWKFKVLDEYMPFVKDVAEPEFDKAVMETLAYIAWRGGSRQCDVVRVRSNKAYNHIRLLIEKEFIESSKAGLSKWLQPTKKFYEYFNLQNGQQLKVGNEKVDKSAEKAIEEGMKLLFG